MNSHLLNKSDINLDSAVLLHDKGQYPAVAHCTYYACFQRIKHIWIHVLKKTEEELSTLCRNRPKNEGSHEVLINQICNYIKTSSRSDRNDDFRIINSEISQLKKLRVKADYRDVALNHRDSSNSLELSNKIIAVLKKHQ